MKRSVLVRRKKEKLKEFFEQASTEEKLSVIKNWHKSEKADKKFNYRLLEAVEKKRKDKGLSKGDLVYIDAIFSAFDINPYSFGAKNVSN